MKVVADRSCGKQNDPRNHWAGFVTLLCVPTGQARSREGYTIARSGCLRNFVILVEVSALCFSFDQGHRNRSIHLLRVIATKREQFENTIQDEERVASRRVAPARAVTSEGARENGRCFAPGIPMRPQPTKLIRRWLHQGGRNFRRPRIHRSFRKSTTPSASDIGIKRGRFHDSALIAQQPKQTHKLDNDQDSGKWFNRDRDDPNFV